MSLNDTIKNRQILDNSYSVIGNEFMAAGQALDFREITKDQEPNKTSEVIRKRVKAVRRRWPTVRRIYIPK